MIRTENAGIDGPHGWARLGFAVLLALGLAACEGEDFQAQVAAADESEDYTTVIELWGSRAY